MLTPVLEAEELGIYRGEHREISLHGLGWEPRLCWTRSNCRTANITLHQTDIRTPSLSPSARDLNRELTVCWADPTVPREMLTPVLGDEGSKSDGETSEALYVIFVWTPAISEIIRPQTKFHFRFSNSHSLLPGLFVATIAGHIYPTTIVFIW